MPQVLFLLMPPAEASTEEASEATRETSWPIKFGVDMLDWPIKSLW